MTSEGKLAEAKINAKSMSKKKRVGLTSLFMILFAGVFQFGTTIDVDETTANQLMDEFEKQVQGIDALGIFFHNATMALMMFLPGFGAVWGAIAGFQTGYAYSAASTLIPALKEFPGLILFITPFGFMELFAYGLAMSRSVLLVKHAVKLRTIFIKPLVIEVGIAIILLILGGYIEDAMIKWADSQGLNLMDMI